MQDMDKQLMLHTPIPLQNDALPEHHPPQQLHLRDHVFRFELNNDVRLIPLVKKV